MDAAATIFAAGMFKYQFYACQAFGGLVFCACKDDIAHRAATKLLGGGFTEHPADGINHIGFAAAVGPDNRGDGFGEMKRCRIGKGFKACQFELF